MLYSGEKRLVSEKINYSHTHGSICSTTNDTNENREQKRVCWTAASLFDLKGAAAIKKFLSSQPVGFSPNIV